MGSRALLLPLLLLAPLAAGAPSEDRLPKDGFIELYNSTVTDEPLEDPKNVSKASIQPPPPPQITIPLLPPNMPFVFPRPFAIPFPFSFPPPPPPPQFPNLDVVQVITVPRPQKNVQVDEDDLEEEETEESIIPIEIPIDSVLEARRAPVTGGKKKKQKKQKKQKKDKKQKKPKRKQKKQKKQKQPSYPQPIIIYQNQEEPVASEGSQPGVTGAQGAQTSYLGYYMVYVVEVRWTGNNYTQTVVTGRPIPAAITVPPTTDSGVVNNLSETIHPANLVNRPQPTPTCLFQRSTTTEHFGTQPEILKPFEATDNPVNQEQIGEESEDSEDLDSVDEDYEDDSDPKRRRKKKLVTSSTQNPKQD